jgi:hypothetical protein
MTIWRMAMRCGDNGPFLHEECFGLGIAAITYDGIAETDFSELTEKSAKAVWKHLAAAQKSSIHKLCYGMRGGDTIFVKAGRLIVGKGVVRGRPDARAYSFNHANKRIVDENGTPWLQQVPVAWRPDFLPLEIKVGSNQRFAIQEISLEDARRVERDLDSHLAGVPVAPVDETLRTESYLRASPAAMKIIERRHNALSNDFASWLKASYGIASRRERGQIDVQFQRNGKEVLAELKICFACTARHAIREALGQLLEYNYYPSRKPTQEWLIVLDTLPEDSDKRYIALLRDSLRLPVYLGWREKAGFAFSPFWPEI